MKSVLGLSFAFLILGVLVMPYSAVGTTVPTSEAGTLFGGECTQNATGARIYVCYNDSEDGPNTCSGAGCGCTSRMPWTTGQTGAKPDPAVACNSSNKCTAPRTLSGTCAAGG